MMRSIHDVASGSFTFANHFFQFDGTTIGGKPSGYGSLTLGDGTVLTGDFINGDLQGPGTKRWCNGSFYTGTFVKGEMHGIGRWLDVTTMTDYTGEFCCGVKSGRGRQVELRNRRIFEGTFHKGLYEGEGVLVEFPAASFMDVEMMPMKEWVRRRIGSPSSSDPLLSRSASPENKGAVASVVLKSQLSFLALDQSVYSEKALAASTTLKSNVSGVASPIQDALSPAGGKAQGPPLTLMHGTFVRGKIHGNVVATFANGDMYEGPAVEGEWCGDECTFYMATGNLRYCGAMEHSKRSEAPNAVIVADVYHASVGSMMAQWRESADQYLTITTSCLVTLSLVSQRTVLERCVVDHDEDTQGKKKGGGGAAKPKAKVVAKAKGSSSHDETTPVTEDLPSFKEVVKNEVCSHEDGRPVRATIYKLAAPLTDAQRAAKRVPRDATRALFATEPLTPRSDGQGDTASSRSPSTRTPGDVVGDRASPMSGRENGPTPGTSRSGSRVAIKTRSQRSLTGFPLDQGKAVLQTALTKGSLTLKIAPLTYESGDYLVKLEVWVVGGIQLAPGSMQGSIPMEPQVFLIPMHVVR